MPYQPRYLTKEDVEALYRLKLRQMEARVLETHLDLVCCPEGPPEHAVAGHQQYRAGLLALEAEYGAAQLAPEEEKRDAAADPGR
jgi:hypothetical protein